jgi:uncharacterized protein (DUF305 family)
MPRSSRSMSTLNWRSAALLGLISSTFSTGLSQLAAARLGRDAAVDWMVVATIPLRDAALQTDPSWPVIGTGVIFHQLADFSWAVVFFGLLGRWTAALRPLPILVLAFPWALFTSALEYFFLVPVVPFWQPIFTLEQPYWVGLAVHSTSASMYPLFPFLRDWMAKRPSPHRRFAAVWSGLAAVGALSVGVVAFLGWQGHELPHVGRNVAYDQAFMRRMAAHHQQGVELARLAAGRAEQTHLRAMAHLSGAAQMGEIAIFEQWWRSWFDGRLPQPLPGDHASMPGMLRLESIEALRSAHGPRFDALFVMLMTTHHEGAIAMADEALHRAGDPRLRLMSYSIGYAQRGEIKLLNGIPPGLPTVRAAISTLLVPRAPEPYQADGPRSP